MSATIKDACPTRNPGPPAPTKLVEGAADSHQHNFATALNPNTIQDALLVQLYLKRKSEAGSEDGPPGEGTEIEQGGQTKRPRITSMASNLLPSSITTTTAQTTSYPIKPTVLNLMDPQTQPTQANPDISFLNASRGPSRTASPKSSCHSSRHTTPVPSFTPSRNRTPVSAPNSPPHSQPSSRVGSPTGWVPPILHCPIPLPPSQPLSRPTLPRHRYSAPSSIDPGFAAMYPQPVNPAMLSSSVPGQLHGVPQPYPEHGYRTHQPPQQHLEPIRMGQLPHVQTERIAYPHPSVFQDMNPNMPHLNFVPQSGIPAVPFVQGPAPGRVLVHPHPDAVEPRHGFNAYQPGHVQYFVQHQMTPQQARNAFLSQPAPHQFQTGHNDHPEKGQTLPKLAPKPPRKGTQSMTIERNADILMDLIDAKVEVGIKNNHLNKRAPGALLASLEGPVDGREGFTNGRCEKAVGTNEDHAIETDVDELLGLSAEEKLNPMHKTFVTQAKAWAEERRLLIKRREELEEEKRVAEERRVADSEQASKERKEYTSKVEYLSSKVKKLQQDMATIIRERDALRVQRKFG